MIGGAFTAVVNSMVNDIITPIIALLVKKNLENWFYVLRNGRTPGATYCMLFSYLLFFYPHTYFLATIAEASADGATTENVGRFCQAIFNFVIIGWILFVIVKGNIIVIHIFSHSLTLILYCFLPQPFKSSEANLGSFRLLLWILQPSSALTAHPRFRSARVVVLSALRKSAQANRNNS